MSDHTQYRDSLFLLMSERERSPRLSQIPDEIRVEVLDVGLFLVSISELKTVEDLAEELKCFLLQKDGFLVIMRGNRVLDPESDLSDHLMPYQKDFIVTLYAEICSKNPKWSIYLKGFNQVQSEIENILPSFKKLLVDAELKFRDFHGTSLPTVDNKPEFLFWKLGELLDKSAPLLNFLRSKHVVAIIGTSGCGKTRTIYEVLCSCYGLFVTCGSPDFKYLMDSLTTHIQKEFPADNFAYLNRFLNSIIVAKLIIFKYLCENQGNIKMTPKLWLLIQLKLQSAELVKIVRQYEEEDLRRQLSDLVSFMRQRNTELDSDLDMTIPLFLDDAQLTSDKFESCFPASHYRNSNNPKITTPLYSVMLTVLSSCTDSSFTIITSGTSLRLDVSEITSVDKPDLNIKYLISNRFSNHSKISSYVQEIFPLLNILTQNQSKWFIGRVGFLANFLTSYAINFNPTVHTLDAFIDHYVESVTGPSSPIGRIFYDLGGPKQTSTLLTILKESVDYYVIHRKSKRMLLIFEEEKLFEIGLGVLTWGPMEINLEVKVDEPLIIKAALNFYEHQIENCSEGNLVAQNSSGQKLAA
jgi:hypothetical protein